MFLILPPSRGVSMAANLVVTFTITPQRPCCNGNKTLKIYIKWASLGDILLVLAPSSGFSASANLSEICLSPTPVAMATKI